MIEVDDSRPLKEVKEMKIEMVNEEIKPSGESRQIERQEPSEWRVLQFGSLTEVVNWRGRTVAKGCGNTVAQRRQRAAQIVREHNAHHALVEASKGVAIMLNTELAKYESEPWAQRVRAALALVDGLQNQETK